MAIAATDRTLSLSTVTAIINAPIEKVDIADWLLHLPDAEYQRCSHAHIAAGNTTERSLARGHEFDCR
jgi:hypothetical protein